MRSELTQEQKFLGFKKAFGTYNAHLASANFLAAFIVAFSIFEDRVTACYMVAKDAKNEGRPSGFTSLARKIEYLRRVHLLDREIADAWQQLAQDRNRLVHDAMWRIDVFDDSHCTRAIEEARRADKVLRRIRSSQSKSG